MPAHCINLSPRELGHTGRSQWYIKYESAGDQHVGKCVSGCSRNNKKFGASCAYWDFSEEAPDAKAASEDRLHNYLKESLPVQTRDKLKIY